MADIGTMEYENAIYLEKNQRDYLAKCVQGTVDFTCLEYTLSGKRCTYNRVTRFCCKRHSTEESISIY